MVKDVICHYAIPSQVELTDEEWEEHKDNIGPYLMRKAKAVQGNTDAQVRLAGRMTASYDRIMPIKVELKEGPD